MTLYFRLCLLLPLLFGLLAGVIAGAENIAFLNFSVMGLFFAGIPYLLFVISAWVWSHRRRSNNYSYAMLLTPFVFGVCVFIYQIAIDFASSANENELFPDIGFAFALAGFAIIISAFYAWPALLVWHIFMLFKRKPKL